MLRKGAEGEPTEFQDTSKRHQPECLDLRLADAPNELDSPLNSAVMGWPLTPGTGHTRKSADVRDTTASPPKADMPGSP